jgi:hypothetical protein
MTETPTCRRAPASLHHFRRWPGFGIGNRIHFHGRLRSGPRSSLLANHLFSSPPFRATASGHRSIQRSIPVLLPRISVSDILLDTPGPPSTVVTMTTALRSAIDAVLEGKHPPSPAPPSHRRRMGRTSRHSATADTSSSSTPNPKSRRIICWHAQRQPSFIWPQASLGLPPLRTGASTSSCNHLQISPLGPGRG